MSFLSTIPAYIRIFIVFAVILISIHRNLTMGHCFSLGAFILGILFGKWLCWRPLFSIARLPSAI
jgi:ABC-type nickel/cobalt efflux system permease component RcnA